MSTETSWEVPSGFTNTGLCINGDGNFAIGDWTNERIHIANVWGDSLGYITLQGSPPNNSVQGVAWDSLRGNYWVSHYASDWTGTIRRYSTAGELLATYPASERQIGPNGCAYEASTDRLLVVYSGANLFSYSCVDGSLQEEIPFAQALGGQCDGLAIDPSDPSYIWVSADSANQAIKIHRTTGVEVQRFAVGSSPENIAFMGGILHICCDRLYHDGIPNGNRVHRYTLQGVPSLVPPRPAAARPEPIVLPRSPVTSAWVQDDPLIIPPTVETAGWPSVWGM